MPALSGPRRFFFVRHGETDWNREGRLQGRHDTDLNALGVSQAMAAGTILARLFAARSLSARELDFVASPLLRTRRTMDLLRRRFDLACEAYRIDDRLTELSFGGWEGMTWREIRASDPVRCEARRRDKWGFVPPGGESYEGLTRRVSEALAGLGDDAVVVGHGGVARVLLHLVTGLHPRRAPLEEILQGRVLVFSDGVARWA